MKTGQDWHSYGFDFLTFPLLFTSILRRLFVRQNAAANSQCLQASRLVLPPRLLETVNTCRKCLHAPHGRERNRLHLQVPNACVEDVAPRASPSHDKLLSGWNKLLPWAGMALIRLRGVSIAQLNLSVRKGCCHDGLPLPFPPPKEALDSVTFSVLPLDWFFMLRRCLRVKCKPIKSGIHECSHWSSGRPHHSNVWSMGCFNRITL